MAKLFPQSPHLTWYLSCKNESIEQLFKRDYSQIVQKLHIILGAYYIVGCLAGIINLVYPSYLFYLCGITIIVSLLILGRKSTRYQRLIVDITTYMFLAVWLILMDYLVNPYIQDNINKTCSQEILSYLWNTCSLVYLIFTPTLLCLPSWI